MDIRKVQKTGDMHYVYLPTSWCKKYTLSSGSMVSLEQSTEGNLIISPSIKEKKLKSLKLKIAEESQNAIQKLMVACYINPLSSFSIALEKGMDFTKLLDQKKLLSLESVELDRNMITCESVPQITDPSLLLKTMVRKIKNMVEIMLKNYNAELINRYEEEIDRSKLTIEKSTMNCLMFSTPSNQKIIEVYYISMLSRDLERMVDHLIRVGPSETKFLNKLLDVIEALKKIIELPKELNYKDAIVLIKKIEAIGDIEVKDFLTYDKRRIKYLLFAVSETIIDWAITNEIENAGA
jgi:phosphate uptake regulator